MGWAFLSVLVLCITTLTIHYLSHEYKKDLRRYTDTIKLATVLEIKLKEMEDLKERMEHLLLKNGLGRK